MSAPSTPPTQPDREALATIHAIARDVAAGDNTAAWAALGAIEALSRRVLALLAAGTPTETGDDCSDCAGQGHVGGEPCPSCLGEGRVAVPEDTGYNAAKVVAYVARLTAERDAALADLAAARGICGERAPNALGGVALGPCTLNANHDGWHRDDDGASWNLTAPPPAEDTDTLRAEVDRLVANVRDTYTDEGAVIYLRSLADKAERLAGGPALSPPARDEAATEDGR